MRAFGIGLIMVLLAVAQAQVDLKTDSRLSKTITAEEMFWPLSDFCKSMTETTGLQIRVAKHLEARKVAVLVNDRPAWYLMEKAAEVSNCVWNKTDDGYTLMQTPAAADLERRTVDAFEKARKQGLEDAINSALASRNADLNKKIARLVDLRDRYEEARHDRDIAASISKEIANLESEFQRAIIPGLLFGAMSKEHWGRFWDGDPLKASSDGEADIKLGSDFLAAVGAMRNLPHSHDEPRTDILGGKADLVYDPELHTVRFPVELNVDGGSFRFLYGLSDHLDSDRFSAAVKTSVYAKSVGNWAVEKQSSSWDLALDLRRIDSGDDLIEKPDHAQMLDCLKDNGFEYVMDAFRARLTFWPKLLVRQGTLKELAESFLISGRVLRIEGKAIVGRRIDAPVLGRYEIAERQISPYEAIVAETKGLELDQLANFAQPLSKIQYSSLSADTFIASWHRLGEIPQDMWPALRLWALLTEFQKDRAKSEEGLRKSQMTPVQQANFNRAALGGSEGILQALDIQILPVARTSTEPMIKALRDEYQGFEPQTVSGMATIPQGDPNEENDPRPKLPIKVISWTLEILHQDGTAKYVYSIERPQKEKAKP
ncbi:MAG: hypothetical protein HUU60_03690 [Armatimonadetes bacterium]|nr:hypothetical protein [Armatimonadota bacterium]